MYIYIFIFICIYIYICIHIYVHIYVLNCFKYTELFAVHGRPLALMFDGAVFDDSRGVWTVFVYMFVCTFVQLYMYVCM